jgi:hypothetical protein
MRGEELIFCFGEGWYFTPYIACYEADEPDWALIILHARLEAAFSAGLCNLQRARSAGLSRGGKYCWDFC